MDETTLAVCKNCTVVVSFNTKRHVSHENDDDSHHNEPCPVCNKNEFDTITAGAELSFGINTEW